MIKIKDSLGVELASGGMELNGGIYATTPNTRYTISLGCGLGCYSECLVEVYQDGELCSSKVIDGKSCLTFKANYTEIEVHVYPNA